MRCDGLGLLSCGCDGLGGHQLDALIACYWTLVLPRSVGDAAIVATDDLLMGFSLLDCSDIPMDHINTTPRPLGYGVTCSGQGRRYGHKSRRGLNGGCGKSARCGLRH